jgi:glycosyltransferase involved in cell wall biosynthesis
MFSEAEMMKGKGHEVFFFTTDKQPFYDKDYQYSEYFPKYIDYKALSGLDLLKNIHKPFYNIEAEKKMSELIDEIKPDIVHEHTSSFHLTPLVLRACYKSNIPVVLTIHGAGYMCPAQTLMIAGERYCTKELCIKGNLVHCFLNKCLGKSLKNVLLKLSIYGFYNIMGFYKNVSAFITPSKAMLGLAKRSGIDEKKLNHIDNFIDNSYLQIQPEYDNKGYFLYVGRLDKEKGLQYLLEAMFTLADNINLRIVGTGDQEIELKALAKSLNLNNVKFLGYKSGKKLEEEYKNCIATILPCKWFETFGLTILESFCFGKPVIASNIGGIPEIIDDGKNGFLIEPGNVKELAKVIEFLHQNPQKVIELGMNGRKKTEEKFNSEVHYKRLVEIYRKVKKGNKNENFVCK